jgi:hypothetical protein
MSVEKYREESKERRERTYDERKAKALAGTKVLYLTCPLCGLNRPLSSYKGEARFEVKPSYAIIQARYGGGRGIGFFLVPEESITLSELKAIYPEVLENLKEQVFLLYELMRKL